MASDLQLLEACLDGDRQAFGQIVERYQALISTIAYSGTGDLALSEDLAQETFLTAWSRLEDLRDQTKLRAWLCGIARNLIKNWRRRQSRDIARHAQALEVARAVQAEAPAPAEQAVTKEEEAAVWQALVDIPETYREPLVLYYREQKSVERVAEALELSEDAVKQRLSRGRKMLRAQVAALVEETLARTRPGEAFTMAVLAALGPATFKAALSNVLVWAALSNGLIATFVILMSRGYLFLILWGSFSAYLLLCRPGWFDRYKEWIVGFAALGLAVLWRGYVGVALLVIGGVDVTYLLLRHFGKIERVPLWLFGRGRSDPLYPWQRWTWDTPPAHWKSKLAETLVWTVLFGAVGAGFLYWAAASDQPMPWGFVAFFALMSLNFAVYSVRIIVHVWLCSRRSPNR